MSSQLNKDVVFIDSLFCSLENSKIITWYQERRTQIKTLVFFFLLVWVSVIIFIAAIVFYLFPSGVAVDMSIFISIKVSSFISVSAHRQESDPCVVSHLIFSNFPNLSTLNNAYHGRHSLWNSLSITSIINERNCHKVSRQLWVPKSSTPLSSNQS